jgi:hypothetical protein
MADETKKRPWWKVRRVWGGIIGTAALAAASIPAAPVIVSVGAIAITTNTVSILLGGIATYVFGYGQGAKVEREK